MVDNHDTLRGYGMVYNANKISSKKKCKFGVDFWEYIVLQYGQSRMTRTGRQQDTPPMIDLMLSVEHVRIAWWKNSEHRTLRTRPATDSRRNGKTKEGARRKIILTMGVQSDTMYSNERP